MSGAKIVEEEVLLGNVSRVNKHCHKSVVRPVAFRAGGSLLVAAERAFGLRDLIDPSVRNRKACGTRRDIPVVIIRRALVRNPCGPTSPIQALLISIS